VYNGLVNPNGTATPILTGEDMYCSDEYLAMVNAGSVDYIHPDPTSSGGVNQCRMAAVYAASKGIYTAIHNSNSPFATAMNCHICAGIPAPYFLACEFHYSDNYAQWQAFTVPQLAFNANGCIPIPMLPGLGVEPSSSISFTTKTYT
jgi:L-alanine-DL-glutamate epimerase-like enolase superfamily enzyme